MTKSEQNPIKKHITYNEILDLIKHVKYARVLTRLYFIKYRYESDSVIVSSERVGTSSTVGHRWQKRWNESGYDGLIPRYTGGRPSKLTQQ
ncbi:MAG: helix-turn-helix domain-containing protein [Methanohalobium sp.]|uniref:helix-turn-helix domain-containing protein n=1 Tax=Methanohalobium sp. TaxID=2837493 RepID=UPI003978A2D7